ncbi:hypothetical protein CC86DRAFT_462965 [Ophiobolus disseminans]|uniref:Uncharacterized protein n=1 Tax=Ophiobolus disseminans TaxID=1469910 RepID=A0A6A7ACF6_9PLEO|nr:hypothetical protein CC86DRAFT_462965 [Ophiobolus disseminans]
MSCTKATIDSEANLAISLSNQTSSPLLRLPTELRNAIYTHMIGTIILTPGLMSIKDPRLIIELSLLRTCRQTHRETALLPFQLNTFGSVLPGMEHFFAKLNAQQRNAVQRVRLSLYLRDTWMKFFSGEVSQRPLSFVALLPGLQRLVLRLNIWHGSDEAITHALKELSLWRCAGCSPRLEVLVRRHSVWRDVH